MEEFNQGPLTLCIFNNTDSRLRDILKSDYYERQGFIPLWQWVYYPIAFYVYGNKDVPIFTVLDTALIYTTSSKQTDYVTIPGPGVTSALTTLTLVNFKETDVIRFQRRSDSSGALLDLSSSSDWPVDELLLDNVMLDTL